MVNTVLYIQSTIAALLPQKTLHEDIPMSELREQVIEFCLLIAAPPTLIDLLDTLDVIE